MKHMKALCLLLFATAAVFAQPTQQWTSTYTIDTVSYEGTADLATDDSGYIYQLIQTAIYPTGGVLHTCVIRKVSADGTIVWSTVYNNNGAKNVTFKSLAIDAAGNVYVAGDRVTPNPNAAFFWVVAKFNSNGAFAWKHELSDDAVENRAHEVLVHNNAVYVAGYTIDPGFTSHSILVKLDTDGNETWKRYSDCISSWEGSVLQLTASGNFVTGCNDSLYVLAPNGTHVAASDTALGLYGKVAVTVDANENIYMLNWEGMNYTIRKFNSNGNLVWEVDNIGNYLAFGDWQIQLTTDEQGNIYAGSIVNSVSGMDSVYIYKLSPQGNILWAKYLDYDPVSLIYRNGKLYAAGNNTNWPDGRVAIIQIDPVTANTDWILTEGDSVMTRSVDKLEIDSHGNFILASRVTGTGNWDAVLAKYAGNITGVNKIEVTQNFTLYPNPTTGNIIINSTLTDGEIKVYDVRGSITGTYLLTSSTTSIDVSQLSSGIYYAKIGNRVKRFVKE